MIRKLLLSLALLCPSGTALAQIPPPPAPTVTVVMSSDTFANGASTGVAGALVKYGNLYAIDDPDYADDDDCRAETDYEFCDLLHLGAAVFPDASCTQSSYSSLIDPEENSAFGLKDRLQNVHNEGGMTFCNTYTFRPHDAGLMQHALYHFGPNHAAETDGDALDRFWERPRLRIMTVGELPQTNNGSKDRVVETLVQACKDFGGWGVGLPSIPTWVIVERKNDNPAQQYGGLVAAAGGTAKVCIGTGKNNCNNDNQCSSGESCINKVCVCDPSHEDSKTIDICDELDDGTFDEEDLRDMIGDFVFGFGPGDGNALVGLMDFGSSNAANGQNKYIDCHLAGAGNNCSDPEPAPTDILGKLSCVRQLPRGVSADDAVFLYCTSTSWDSCTPLDPTTDIEWIDEARTLFVVKGLEGKECRGVFATECREGAFCETDLPGRCAAGVISCESGTEECVSIYNSYPEICNGLDDDCDGSVDNFAASWQNFPDVSIPDEDVPIHCNLQPICTCPDDHEDQHVGDTMDEFFAGWTGQCTCGENLAPPTETAPQPVDQPVDQQATCAAAGPDNSIPFSFLVLVGLGLASTRRRQRR